MPESDNERANDVGWGWGGEIEAGSEDVGSDVREDKIARGKGHAGEM